MTATRLFRRILCVLLAVCLLLITALPVSAEQLLYEFPETEDEKITAPSAMLLYIGMQPEQDVTLYEKAADTRYQPGSLMRVAMVGYAMKLITEQNIDIDTATASYSLTLFNHYVAGTGLHVALMNFGETWTLRDLLTLCTIQTAADCAVTLANRLSGSPEAFVDGLNAFAAELGCTNSHFTNVIGLNEEGQYMSARDVVTFTRYAMQYPEITQMLELTEWTVQPVSGGSRRSWPSSNDMLRQSTSAFYTYAVGGRTGGTLTETSLVEYGSLDGYDYMAVVMGAQRKDDKGNLTNTAYAEARLLIRWGLIGFNYETLLHKDEPVGRVPVSGCSERQYLSLVPAADLNSVVIKGTDLSKVTRKVTYTQESYRAPIEKGDTLGSVTLYLEGKEIASADLVAGETAPYSTLYAIWEGIRSAIFSGWMLAFIIIAILLIVGYVWLTVRYNRKRRRKWKS